MIDDDRHEHRDDRQERREHERQHREGAEAADQRPRAGRPGPPVLAAVLGQGVEACQVHRRAGDRRAASAALARLLRLRVLAERPSRGRASGRRPRTWCGRRRHEGPVTGRRVGGDAARRAARARVRIDPRAGPRVTPGESTVLPVGRVTTGRSGAVSPPVPVLLRDRHVGLVALLAGHGELLERAFVAGSGGARCRRR